MIHCKGTPGDYNGWANFTGDDSWRYEKMAEHERFYESKIKPTMPKDEDLSTLSKLWKQAAKESDQLLWTDDYNHPDKREGYTIN